MKKILLVLSFLITGITLAPAQTNSGVVWVSIDPTGAACSAVGPLVVYFPSGTVFSCQSGHLAAVGGSSGGTCSSLAGDVTGTCAANTVVKVHGAIYPASPSVNTVPVVTSASAGGTVTYEAVPNAALANSSITVSGTTCTLGGSCSPSGGSNVPFTGWSNVGFTNPASGATFNDFSGGGDKLSLGMGNTTPSPNLRMICRALPSSGTPPWSVIMTIEIYSFRNSGGGTQELGLLLYDGSIKAEELGSQWILGNTSTESNIQVRTWAAITGGSPSTVAGPSVWFQQRLTMKVSNDGVHRIWSLWNNTGSGGAFSQILSENTGTFLTETQACFGGFSNDGSNVNIPTLSGNLTYYCGASATTCNGF